jgi:hypothetical protein
MRFAGACPGFVAFSRGCGSDLLNQEVRFFLSRESKRKIYASTVLSVLALLTIGQRHAGFLGVFVLLPLGIWLGWSAYVIVARPYSRLAQAICVLIWSFAIVLIVGAHLQRPRHHQIPNPCRAARLERAGQFIQCRTGGHHVIDHQNCLSAQVDVAFECVADVFRALLPRQAGLGCGVDVAPHVARFERQAQMAGERPRDFQGLVESPLRLVAAAPAEPAGSGLALVAGGMARESGRESRRWRYGGRTSATAPGGRQGTRSGTPPGVASNCGGFFRQAPQTIAEGVGKAQTGQQSVVRRGRLSRQSGQRNSPAAGAAHRKHWRGSSTESSRARGPPARRSAPLNLTSPPPSTKIRAFPAF